jgi:hypothetical protein
LLKWFEEDGLKLVKRRRKKKKNKMGVLFI